MKESAELDDKRLDMQLISCELLDDVKFHNCETSKALVGVETRVKLPQD